MEAHVIYCKSVGVLMIIAILSEAFGMPCPLDSYYDCLKKNCVKCSEICENAELNGTQDECARHRNCYNIWHSDTPPNENGGRGGGGGGFNRNDYGPPESVVVDTTTKSHNASKRNEIFDISSMYPFYSTTPKQTTTIEPTTSLGQTEADETKTVQMSPSESTTTEVLTVADDTQTVQTPPSESITTQVLFEADNTKTGQTPIDEAITQTTSASISLLEVVRRQTLDEFVICAGICLLCIGGYCINKCCCRRRIKCNSSIV